MTIGAHGNRHINLARAAPSAVEEEMTASRRILEHLLQREVVHFAYPFGNTRDVSRAAWQAVRDAGYNYAFTTLGGTLEGSMNPWLLPRYGLAPKEPNLSGMLPLLRVGNRRVVRWQRTLA